MISWRQADVRHSGIFSFVPLGSKVRRVVGSPGHEDFPNLGVPNQIAVFEMVFAFLRLLLTLPRVLLLRNYFHDKWQTSRELFCKELFQNSNKSNNFRWFITFFFDFLFRLRFLECCQLLRTALVKISKFSTTATKELCSPDLWALPVLSLLLWHLW